MYQNIPLEMRTYKQWVVWRYEEFTDGSKPTKVPYCASTGKLASVTNPATWCSFDECVNVLAAHPDWYSGLGFVLTDNDPYGFIDLDAAGDDQISLDRQLKIYSEFQSYAERSPSGQGLHIIVRGSIPSGRKRSKIEVYSSGRYMTMTGNVFRDTFIADYNDLFNALYTQMGEGKDAQAFYAGLEKAHTPDDDILRIAASAANGEKFHDLFTLGNWQKYYPSQSEADFALIDIIAFYSENRYQTQQLFLQSALGQREKSRAQYRINYMLDRCFDRMLPPLDIEHLRNAFNDQISKRNNAPDTQKIDTEAVKPLDDIYTVPPGLVGEIAQFIYAQAPRPVAEIALVGALGLMAGIVGRAYNINDTGLNQYILLLAPTGSGKEAIASGVSKLMAQVVRTVPAAMEFQGPGQIASPQALTKYLANTAKSFVSIVGEFGFYLQQMASPHAAPHLMGLLALMLDLFNKSGENDVLRPSIYSDKEKNTASVQSPAFSLMGETVPEGFYETLHDGMITNGLLPRFTIIEYTGKRPQWNKTSSSAVPTFDVVEKLSTICAQALQLNSQNKAISVQIAPDAEALLDTFNDHADLNINSSDKDVRKQLWNRAHLKALKLAGLIAVGVNPWQPVVTLDLAQWAIRLVESDVRNLLQRFDQGEIGIDNDETKQLTSIVAAIKHYLSEPWSDLVKYAVGEGFDRLHGDRLIPYSYLQRKLASVGVFKKDRRGATLALKNALKTLAERGDLREVGRAELTKGYNMTALTFAVTNAKVFL